MSLKSLLAKIGIGKEDGISSGLFIGRTDFHSHILPGVDDGVKTIGESIAILDRYEAMGIERVWLTPHIMEDVPNNTADLRKRFDELRDAYSGNVELKLAAENMIDNLFVERLEADDLLPLGEKGDMLLVETSYFNPPQGLDEILERIVEKGYRPLLAHPERYRYMEPHHYATLKERGILLQLNLLSLTGFYGQQARDKSHFLAEKGYYDFLGSDIHRLAQADDLGRMTNQSRYRKQLDKIRLKE